MFKLLGARSFFLFIATSLLLLKLSTLFGQQTSFQVQADTISPRLFDVAINENDKVIVGFEELAQNPPIPSSIIILSIEGPGEHMGYRLRKTDDKDYYITIEIVCFGDDIMIPHYAHSPGNVSAIAKLNSLTGGFWAKKSVSFGSSNIPNIIQSLSGDLILLCSTHNNVLVQYLELHKLDSNGNEIWKNKIQLPISWSSNNLSYTMEILENENEELFVIYHGRENQIEFTSILKFGSTGNYIDGAKINEVSFSKAILNGNAIYLLDESDYNAPLTSVSNNFSQYNWLYSNLLN